MVASFVEVRPHQEVKALAREPAGRGKCYIVTDRIAKLVLCAQRLPAASAWLNTHVCKADHVSVASLYESADCGRLVHRRFGVVRTTLEDAPSVLAEARKHSPTGRVFVLSYPHNLTVA